MNYAPGLKAQWFSFKDAQTGLSWISCTLNTVKACDEDEDSSNDFSYKT